MSKVISIHSFRGGTGKSNTSANLAAILALEGRRVGVIDTDIQSPGIHVLFGLKATDIKHSLNEYLWGECQIEETAVDVTANLTRNNGHNINFGKGQVFLIPSSMEAGEIARVLREGTDVDILRDGLRDLLTDLDLDVLVIDTHPGLNEETLLSIAFSDALVVVMRPDEQDYQGTKVTVEVARKLGVERMYLVVNKTSRNFDFDEVKTHIEATYNTEVLAVLPYSENMMDLGSAGIFALRYPDHLLTAKLKQVAHALVK